MEFLDIVNENDEIIGVASKEDIYKKLLCHRIVHVLIFNNEAKMFLQKRSTTVSFCPDFWSTAVGGHVDTGESYEQAALREYTEELGTTSVLELIGKDFYTTPNTPNKFFTTFKTVFNSPFYPNSEEVSEITAFNISEIKNMIAAEEKFHPELLFILNKYYL
jgi:isopentenyldiphosphate isomerase